MRTRSLIKIWVDSRKGMIFLLWLQNVCYDHCFTYHTNFLYCFLSRVFYSYFRTNLPKEVMTFPDIPFPSEWKSFITHQQVLKYLEDYTSHFNLYISTFILTLRSQELVLSWVKTGTSHNGRWLWQMLILRNLKVMFSKLSLYVLGKFMSI